MEGTEWTPIHQSKHFSIPDAAAFTLQVECDTGTAAPEVARCFGDAGRGGMSSTIDI